MNPTEINQYLRDYAKANPTITPEQFTEGVIARLQQMRNQRMARLAEIDCERIMRRNSGFKGARA